MTSKRRKGPSNKVKQEKNKIKKIKESKGKKNLKNKVMQKVQVTHV
jgi:hypothetical protein